MGVWQPLNVEHTMKFITINVFISGMFTLLKKIIYYQYKYQAQALLSTYKQSVAKNASDVYLLY